MFYLVAVFLALIGFVVAGAHSAYAEESEDFYLSISAGAVFPEDIEVGVDDRIKTDTAGYHVEMGLGGYLTSSFRWELASSYRRFDLKDSQDGYFGAYIPSFNIYYSPLVKTNRHDPFFGFGVGVGLWDFHDFDDEDIPTDPETAFVFNAMAGYNYRLTDYLAVGVSYRFLYSEPEFFEDLLNYKQFHHSILLTTTWRIPEIQFISEKQRAPLDLYVSISAGPIFTPGISSGAVALEEADGDMPARLVNVGANFDAGYHFELGIGGYVFNNFRLELANGYRRYDIEDVDSLEAYSILANVYYDFLGVSNRQHDPYIGFGMGLGLWQGRISTDLKSRAREADLAVDDSLDAAFMLNTMAGYNYFLTDQLGLGVSYRFSYSEPEFNQFNHSVLGTITWSFSTGALTSPEPFISFWDDPALADFSELSPYVSLSAGLLYPQNSDAEIGLDGVESVSLGSFSGTFEVDFERSLGFDLNGAVGIFPHQLVRTELAVGYRRWETEWKVAGIDAQEFNVDNDYVFNAATISFNTYYHFTGKDSFYQPYVGLGLGGLFGSLKAKDTDYDEDIKSFLVQAMGGYNHRLSDRVSVGGSYRFSWSEINPNSDFGELKSELFGHNFLVTLMIGF